jgi:dTDP-4-dehydrorhamnose 3,5-epimerase
VVISPTNLPDVILIKPARYDDERGWFSATFSLTFMEKHRLPLFIQDNESLSRKGGTVRGLHFQRRPFAQAKLVRCVRGSVFDVALDIRPDSPTFGQHLSKRMSELDGEQLLIPAGFAHGFCTLEPDTVIQYKVSAPYSPSHESGVAWDDPALKIEWPVSRHEATLSDRDQSYLPLAQTDLFDV